MYIGSLWPQTKGKKILAEFEFGGGTQTLCMHLSGSIAILSLEVLEQSREFTKYNWQRASVELAICTARIEGRRAVPGVLPHALRHYMRCGRK